MKFGKNRVQYEEFLWKYYKFERYKVYFYKGGVDVAVYTAKAAENIIDDLEEKFDYYLDEEAQINFIVYNKINHFRQSNIGIGASGENNIGGITRIEGNNVFLYFEGDHKKLEKQIRTGMAEIVVRQMMYGTNWKERIKNSTLLTLPGWYIDGIVAHASELWSIETDSRVKDLIMSGRFEKFNRLAGEDSKLAGHALWHYIAEVYGQAVIPNVLYMARISRNVESGFLFVLGVSLNTLNNEALKYYMEKYEVDDEMRNLPQEDLLSLKTKKSKVYRELKVSPDGKYAAFITNELGKNKVWLYDLERGKKKKVFKLGYKLERINDYSNPLLGWHPSGNILAIIHEKKGQILLTYYVLDEKKKVHKPIFKLEKILDFNYSDDGKNMVLSAISQGQSDIYFYKVAPNVQLRITNDIYDDFNARFADNSNKIVFSSNRPNDTLKTGDETKGLLDPNKDFFIYDHANDLKVLTRLTNTPNANETHPAPSGKKNQYTYLSDKNGIVNRYLISLDSVISHIDTALHYRYITKSQPISNYSRNILEYQVNLKSKKYSEIFYHDNRHRLRVADLQDQPEHFSMEMENTGFKEKKIKESEKQQEDQQATEEMIVEKASPQEITYTSVSVPEEEIETVNPAFIDINNYAFEKEKDRANTERVFEPASEQTEKKDDDELSPNRFMLIENPPEIEEEEKEFTLPLQRNYNLSFAATDITTQVFDFDYANQIYQPFIAPNGPYVNPGVGSVVKISLLDLFENHEIEGGIRYSWNNKNIEYFLSLENRQRRLDKKYVFQRQTFVSVSEFTIKKLHINQSKVILKYPFSEISSLHATFNLRNDRSITMSSDQASLNTPDVIANWGGMKLEYIFDNVLNKGLNLYNGTRLKIFGEHYRQIEDYETEISVIGIDARHYQKIHRDIIWANRLAASTSFGNKKLVYYMGAVDNWMVLSNRQKFDFGTSISQDQNYYFQTIATPMRGFIQNTRNGNSFALINTEVRVPVFKYFMNKPIKSDFLQNFQFTLFGDAGTAWTGKTPWADDNSFNIKIYDGKGNLLNPGEEPAGPLKITVKNQKGPVVGGFGWGLRTRLWGYFVRFDYAWGVEDGIIQKPITYLSMGLDF
ncbi:hypothetical protein JYU20_01720 [Bacteroidales bacterium AH-315-I05]|nr:hypothetical protein [Bacteroidales bacterium AH-315-I05]